MTSGWLVLVTLALGVAVGAVSVTVVVMAARRGANATQTVHTGLPDGAREVIDALESSGIALDPSNNVLTATPGAYAAALVDRTGVACAEVLAIADDVRQSGEPQVRDITLRRGTLTVATLDLRIRAVRLGVRYVLVLAEDRTETHRVEDMRRDFVANVSHELKTPIGAVSLLAEALESASEDPEQVRRFAARLSGEAARLARITGDIIELHRLESTDALATSESVLVRDVVNAAVSQNRVDADLRGVELAVRGEKSARVVGDPMLLGTAVHNLLANAIRHSPMHSRVGVGVRHTDGLVEITVTDQGEGIPEADLDRIFERFFRVDQARSRQTGGTGLGLAIVKHVVHNHGGDIRVWSQPGRGSTFVIRLPEDPVIEPHREEAFR